MALNFLNNGYFAGKVGIGTESPGALLHLVGTTPELRIATAADGQTARLGLYEDAAGTHHGGYIQYVGGGDTLRLGIVNSTVNTDVITIKDNFNVGIGTTNPAHTLDVRGPDTDNAIIARFYSSEGSRGDFIIRNGSSTAPTTYIGTGGGSEELSIGTEDTNAIYIDNQQRVGIGTTSPDSLLTVSGSSLQNSNNAGIELSNSHNAQTVLLIENTTSRKYEVAVGGSANSIGNGSFYIYDGTAGDARLVIDSSGNVGIGDTTPLSKLEVAGSIKSTNYDTSHTSESGVTLGYNVTESMAYLETWTSKPLTFRTYNYQAFNISGNEAMRIDTSRNVGIGTTSPTGYGASANTLEVRGASGTGAGLIRVSNAGNTVGAAFYSGSASSTLGTQTNHELNIATNNTSRVVIGNTGAVKFSAYAAGTLVTDASGNISVSSGGGAGGPYLPLSAGPSYPLTGDLYQTMGAIGVAQTDQDYLAKIYESNADGFMSLYTGQPTPLERIRISSYGDSFFVPANNGKVGIGTTTPNNLLSLRKDVADGDVAIYLQNYNSVIGSTNETVSIKFAHGNDSGTGYVGAAIVGGKEGDFESNPSNVKGFISFNTNNGSVSNVLNERMRIEAGGNVGIGTTSPGSRRLSVVKDTGITAGFNDITEFLDTTLGGGGSVSLNIGKANSSKNLGKMAFKYVSSGSNSNALNFGFYDADNLMTLQAGGNVGIGTTSPVSLLHIKGADPVFTIQDTSTGTAQASSTLRLGESGSGGVLDVYWDIKQASDILNTHLEINHSANGNALTILDNKNVGIGTTSPTAKLHIVGTGLFTGLVSGITPVAAANFVTKAYVDGSGGGTGPFLPLAGGTLTGNLNGTSATFAGNVVTGPVLSITGTATGSPYIQLIQGGTQRAYLQYADTGDNLVLQSDGQTTFKTGGNIDALNLDSSQNAIFAGDIIGGGSITIGSGGAYNAGAIYSDANWGMIFRALQTSPNNSDFLFANSADVERLRITSTTADFSVTVDAPTFVGDLNGTINTATTGFTQANAVNNTTIATTAYVTNKIGEIPAGLQFEGTWDASTGNPPSASPENGQFWIVSVAGSTNLSGITDWKVGDWAIYVVAGSGTDGWQKVDNSSVLDGSGTGGTVTGWAGSGTSNTLTNSPITFSGNNTSFPDDATFDTNIILEGNIYHKNDTNTYFGFNPGASEDDTIIFNTAGSERMRIDSSGRVGIGTSDIEETLTIAKTMVATELL